MMPIINPWLAMKAGKYLGELAAGAAEAEFREEQRRKEEQAKKKREKEMQKLKEKWAEEEYKRNNPHCTWMFNHFDFGNEWVYYKTLY